ncbi:DNA-binding protein [Streptomyces sp. AC563]|uniref:DUF5753 domain-containing protein n=1 Tax=Streptomyces buecherae TaxID=2763006 RepID=UPI00164D42B7|nr:DUF5753 domain-containing protein [Streptomyces buecherae]MBC3989216.1 DNA-binding protein [Streptomyces buecherae]
MNDEQYVPWSTVTQTGLGELQHSGLPLYERTRRFRIYEPGVVPGLAQTEAYATALMGRIVAFYGMLDDTAAAVAGRLSRQRVLHEGDHEVSMVIEEWVLRANIGGADVMREQFDHLAAVTELPRVKFGIIPMGVPRGMWPTTGFFLFDDAQARTELPEAEVIVTTPAEIDIYARTHAELAGMAVYGEQARALIEDARAALG